MKSWKLVSSKRIRLNRYRSSLKLRYRLPNGRLDDFYVDDTGRIVCALVLTRDKKIVLARQFRPGPDRVLNELPGGGVHSSETPRQAIIREVLEETGFRGTTTLVVKSFTSAWSRKVRFHFVITNAVRLQNPSNEYPEFTQATLIPLAKFLRHVRSGNLTDGETAYRGLDFLHIRT